MTEPTLHPAVAAAIDRRVAETERALDRGVTDLLRRVAEIGGSIALICEANATLSIEFVAMSRRLARLEAERGTPMGRSPSG